MAQKLTRDALLPPGRQRFRSDAIERPDLSTTPCFEVSDVYSLAYQLASDIERIAEGPLTSFLPAPRTWIEWGLNGSRHGLLLQQEPGSATVTVAEFLDSPCQDWFGAFGGFSLCLQGENAGLLPSQEDEPSSGWYANAFSPENLVPAFLLIINSPSVIEREVIPPHRGLQKELRAAACRRGEPKLLPWTKIRLGITGRVGLPGEARAKNEHITGAKALHFCRAHVRVRLGRLEFVRAHWRGDADLGTRRSSYTVIGDHAPKALVPYA